MITITKTMITKTIITIMILTMITIISWMDDHIDVVLQMLTMSAKSLLHLSCIKNLIS